MNGLRSKWIDMERCHKTHSTRSRGAKWHWLVRYCYHVRSDVALCLLFVKLYKLLRTDSVVCLRYLQVRCGCFYTTLVQKTGPSVRYLGPRFHNFLWIVTADGISSHVTLFTTQQPMGPTLKEASTFSLVEVKVTSAEFSPATQMRFDNEDSPADKVKGDLVWLGTESRRCSTLYLPTWCLFTNFVHLFSRILLYCAQDPEKSGQVGALNLSAAVVQLRYHWDQMFVALANGTVAIFKRNMEGSWELNAPATLVTLGQEPVVSLLPIGSALYAACGRNVFVLDGITGETLVWPGHSRWQWSNSLHKRLFTIVK